MSYDCDICQGEQKIRLPVRQRLSMSMVVSKSDLPTTVTYRDYPCPQCTKVARIETLQAVKEEGDITLRYANRPDFIDYCKRSLAHALIDKLLHDGFVQFHRGPDYNQNLTFKMSATLGVVRLNQLDNLEERIAQRQEEVARLALNEAINQIWNWGSHYSLQSISKRDADNLINEALTTVLKRQAKNRQPI